MVPLLASALPPMTLVLGSLEGVVGVPGAGGVVGVAVGVVGVAVGSVGVFGVGVSLSGCVLGAWGEQAIEGWIALAVMLAVRLGAMPRVVAVVSAAMWRACRCARRRRRGASVGSAIGIAPCGFGVTAVVCRGGLAGHADPSVRRLSACWALVVCSWVGLRGLLGW